MASQFTIWLMPPEEARRRYVDLIDEFSRRFGTPRFDPHITLCSTSELDETASRARVQALATRLAPVPVHLTEIGYTDEYFRCFFIHAEKSAALLAAHRAACESLDRAPSATFMPHLSLIYGALAANAKERLVREIGRRFDATFVADRLALCVPDGSPPGWRLHGPYPLTGAAAART